MFAAPTSAGVATIACFAPPGGGAAFRGDCERVAGSLALNGETGFPVGADPAYAEEISRLTTALGKRRKAGRTALAGASTPVGQRQAAAALSDTYAIALADLGSVESSPVTAPATTAISRAVAGATNAYRQLSKAKNPAAFRRATANVKRAEARVNAALARLKALGYDPG